MPMERKFSHGGAHAVTIVECHPTIAQETYDKLDEYPKIITMIANNHGTLLE